MSELCPVDEYSAHELAPIRPWPKGAAQCHNCGGLGCHRCQWRGWYADSNHPIARRCYNDGCRKPLPPDQYAVYCSVECAVEDA
jgi:hypothetical protein